MQQISWYNSHFIFSFHCPLFCRDDILYWTSLKVYCVHISRWLLPTSHSSRQMWRHRVRFTRMCNTCKEELMPLFSPEKNKHFIFYMSESNTLILTQNDPGHGTLRQIELDSIDFKFPSSSHRMLSRWGDAVLGEFFPVNHKPLGP